VEEQFYIVCPLVLLVTPKRWRIPLVLGLMAWAVHRRSENALAVQRQAITPVLFQFSTMTQLDTLLGGVLLALVLGAGPLPRWADVLARPSQILGPLIIAGLVMRPGLGQAWTRETGARNVWEVSLEFTALWIGFACVIATAVVQDGWLRRFLAWRAFAWLGRISYGLYMYHILAIRMGRSLFGRLPWFANKDWWETIFIFALNVGIAAISYYTLERFFLRLKERWTRVPSRPV
jgi:peptidoglycan/LPS O-acetylase OafA/YrhL